MAIDQSVLSDANIEEHYDAKGGDHCSEWTWCHLSGWWRSDMVGIAELVPKCLTQRELTGLFGNVHHVNGLTMHRNIKRAFEAGQIALIPLPGHWGSSDNLRLKCIIVDQCIREQPFHTYPGTGLRGVPRELENCELVFLNGQSPCPQFLYFRLILTYIHAKRTSNIVFTSSIERKAWAWDYREPQVSIKTLGSLVRKVADFELPPCLYPSNADLPNIFLFEHEILKLAKKLRYSLPLNQPAAEPLEVDQSNEDQEDDYCCL
ncbi:hypothetical protein BDV25DRAFT_136929 [Aspergillus avenaceus]|uniref:Uncharacterized protein n=1 Tax=Aspergillus avenaceus TaxID=36643 RepID=A0A5N6U3W2_ASPAV|nr:hypothetical protein BDV25DRAFT_136929 [Aspergillus avenaceus]